MNNYKDVKGDARHKVKKGALLNVKMMRKLLIHFKKDGIITF